MIPCKLQLILDKSGTKYLIFRLRFRLNFHLKFLVDGKVIFYLPLVMLPGHLCRGCNLLKPREWLAHSTAN